EPGELLDGVAAAIRSVTGRETTPSTSGGTSDGRFIATLGTQVVELGPVNATIHQVDEHILASDLDLLTEFYYQTLVNLLACWPAPCARHRCKRWTMASPARPPTASTVRARATSICCRCSARTAVTPVITRRW